VRGEELYPGAEIYQNGRFGFDDAVNKLIDELVPAR
jgi:hypothetical protein